jgi:hypothetical protein
MKRFAGMCTVLFFIVGSIAVSGQTPDGYLLVGSTMTYITGYGTDSPDMLVYRLDQAGNVTWFDHYGGVFQDEGITGIQTSDGGFAVAGWGQSYSYPIYHFVLFKLDGSGNELWHRDYGGSIWEACRSLRQTADGGYIIGGDTTSYGAFPGDLNMLLYKLDAAGAKQWRKSFGGVGSEWFSTAIQTADGGYLMVGDNSTYTHGNLDFLVYKLDANGQKQWRKNYGGVDSDATWMGMETPNGSQVVQTSDGGYAFCGATYSYSNGATDFIVYKINAAGAKEWRKNFGGMYTDDAMAIDHTADGGFVVSGWTSTYTHGTPNYDHDFLVYKLDAAGKKQWRKNFGGEYPDVGLSVQQTSDGGYILAGYSLSYLTGNLWDPDLLVYRLDAAGNKVWRKNYGGSEEEWNGHICEVVH